MSQMETSEKDWAIERRSVERRVQAFRDQIVSPGWLGLGLTTFSPKLWVSLLPSKDETKDKSKDESRSFSPKCHFGPPHLSLLPAARFSLASAIFSSKASGV